MIMAYGLKLTTDTADEDGVAYTQLITVEHKSGLKLTFFDPRMLCESDDIGKLRQFSANVPLCSSIEHVDKPEFFIKPFVDASNFILPTADICGTIQEITWSFRNEKYPYAVLDIGIGTILLKLDRIGDEKIFKDLDRLKIYKKNDNLFIKFGQLYLYNVVKESA